MVSVPISTTDRLPSDGQYILWWYPAEPKAWRLGWYKVDMGRPPGFFGARPGYWAIADGPTWWMVLPPSPER